MLKSKNFGKQNFFVKNRKTKIGKSKKKKNSKMCEELKTFKNPNNLIKTNRNNRKT